MFSFLSLLTALLPCRAQSGHPGGAHGTYVWSGPTGQSPAYSGGQCVISDAGGPGTPIPYGPRAASAWGGGQSKPPNGSTVTETCSGAILATFTWKPDPSNPAEPPPLSVIVQQNCTILTYLTPGATANGSTGLGQSGSGAGLGLTGTLYTVQSNPGPSFSITPPCSPSLTVTTPATSSVSGGTVQYSATVLSPYLQAHSTVDTASWDAAHPRFFSGTNCSVSGTALAYSTPPSGGSYPSGGIYVKQATLSLGGTVVKSYYDGSVVGPYPLGAIIGTNQASVPLSVIFDSTHFADNSAIVAQLIVTDSGGFTYTVPFQANAFNRAYVLGNDTQDVGSLSQGRIRAQNAAAQFNICNQPRSGYPTVPYMKDNRATILSDLPLTTDFYIYTHGAAVPSIFGDCWAFPDNPNNAIAATDASFGPTTVTMAIANKTVSQPPYNFVDIDGCDTAANGVMAQAFGIISSSVDLSYLSYQTEAADSQHNTDWTKQVLTNLSSGDTIIDAMAQADSLLGKPQYQDDQAHMQIAVPHVWGDNATKLHGVYGVAGTQWFK